MNRVSGVVAGLILLFLLAACGGGGDAPPPPPGPPPTGNISTSTVLAVASRAVDIALQSGGFGTITDIVGLTVADSGSAGVSKPAFGQPGLVSTFAPETTGCAVSGFETRDGQFESPITVSAGDYIDYEWDNCDNGQGEIIDGIIRMTFTEFEGNLLAGRILLVVSLTAENFVVDRNGDVSETNGDLTLIIDSRNQPETVITTEGNSLVIDRGESTESLSDFFNKITEDTSMFPSHFETEVTGTASSTLFSGTVNYDTPIPFEATGNEYPYTGEMRIVGTANASIRLIALDPDNVRIEADYNGDGALDATIDTTWQALVDG